MTIHQTTIRPAVTPAEQRFLDLYAGVSGKLPGAGSAAVRAWRDAARDAFIILGVPHRRVEEWKYTDLRALMPEVHPLGGLDLRVPDVSVEAAIGKSLAQLDAYRAVFVGGRFRPDLSTIHDAHGVTFVPLHQVLEDDGASAQATAKFTLPQRDVIAALSTALATDGAILAVSPKTRLEKPIHMIFISTDEKHALYALQHEINIGEEADVSLIETHGSHQSQAISHTRLAIACGRIVEACEAGCREGFHAFGLSGRYIG